jgi:integrase
MKMGKDRTGSIVKRKDGKLYARITYKGEDGDRHDVTRLATDRKDARRIIKELLNDLDEQGEKAIGADRMKFSEAVETYRNKKAIPPVIRDGRRITGLKSWQTLRIYLDALNAYFGEMRLRDIKAADLEDFKLKRLATPTQYKRERTLSAVQRELETLRAVLRWCVKRGWLRISPFEKCEEPIISKTAEARRDRVLSVEEETALLAACVEPRSHLRPLIICALDTAMRRGEIFQLRWLFVNLHQGVINLPGEITKTGKPRSVPITPRLRTELEALKERANGDDDTLVFGGITDIKKSFGTACRIAKIEDLHFHDLRHSATTRLIAAGVNPALAMSITGHDQMSTFQRYLNPQAYTLRDVAERLHTLNEGDGDKEGEGAKGEFIN